ncbi:MAG TPA: tripartite tricarboxylate transporter substrate binding protein [Ramlibacter sp.]|nr:tripartite tricarboxylate transporter substrate binding protein [Ramlibacter sp.]
MNSNFFGRRVWLAAAASALAMCGPSAWAQEISAFPVKPVRIVVPLAPGGATDALARLLGEKLAVSFGQPVIVDNKAGAAGIIGTDAVAKAPADGHTIVLGLSNSLLTNQYLYTRLPYHAQKDLALVYQIATAPLVLVVHPSVTASNGPELLKYVKANKGKISYGSYGLGAYPHLAGSYMSLTQQADMTHVPYKGEAPMVQDLLGGQIQMAYASALQVKQHVEAGKLKAIGVTGERRMLTMPTVPTLVEQGLKDEAYRLTGWLAFAVPAATNRTVIRRIASDVRTAVMQPDVKARIEAMGFEVKDSSPELFLAQYKKEAPVWEQLIKKTGAKLD